MEKKQKIIKNIVKCVMENKFESARKHLDKFVMNDTRNRIQKGYNKLTKQS